MLALPYCHLNLRRNPFGEIDADDTARLALVDIDDVIQRLHTDRFAAQFLGDKGFGKTTHLLAIRARCRGAGYVHIPEGERRDVPTGRPVLIDESQRLTRRQRRRVFASRTPLVLGSHEDHSGDLVRAGREVVTIRPAQHMDAERLCAVLNARIQWARRTPGPLPRVRLETARDLLSRFGPNVRGILGELYGTFQCLNGVTDV